MLIHPPEPAERRSADIKDNKKGLWNALLFVLILSATIYGVFRGQDMGALRQALARCRADWLACAVGCVVVFLMCEATALHLLLSSFGMGLRQGTSIFSACIGFFFSAITPSSTGGQPMEVYYLRRKGIPVSVTSMALLVMALSYKLVLVLAGLALWFAAPGFLRTSFGGMMFLFRLGFLLTAGWTVFLMFLVFRPRLARAILIWGMSVLEELRILKDREKHQASLEVTMDTYRDAAAYLRRHPAVMLAVLLIMALRRAAQFSVTYCVYRALGLEGTDWLHIAALHGAICIAADMLPLPGGMGVSEALFAKAFGTVFGGLVLPGMVLSRGIGHYFQLILCGCVTMLALALTNRKKREDL